MKLRYTGALALIWSIGLCGIASAGECTAQIEKLQERLSSSTTGAQIQPLDKSQQPQAGLPNGNQQGVSQSAPANAAAAQDSLNHAQQLDKAGKEDECQAEVTKAKAAFGAQ